MKSIGPLEGMTLFAPLGPAGIVTGLVLGPINIGVQFIWPDAYDNIKDGGYKLYDKGKVVIGKAISQRVDTVKHVYKGVQNAGKSIGKVIPSIKMPKVKWG
ncbi:MAG: hypothetical protein L0K87_01375 [Lactococcus sp.]|nr:hypothetical protein [Lactococcus sp.]MDN5403614.1 hypothetical protein [Lactococcus sp.]MDN5462709.1 hypothetical protein [Lactococcus sp.]MDN5493326.1 hypothetical protein [Lactococcus sp.]MDN5982397.1 hypothetical protein [Lactococcus sp.]MDN6013917.1 hypothetical protein [Lactococcus sp.]